MLKRIAVFKFLAVLLLLVGLLAACGQEEDVIGQEGNGSEENNASSENNNEEETEAKVEFPERQITIIVTHGAGGSIDLIARSIQPYVEKELGVPVVVENRPGAGGSIAGSEVWNATPDGYTLLVSAFPSFHTGEVVQGDDYKILEFEHVYNWHGDDSLLVAVDENSEYQTFEDLMEASKEKTITMSGAGRGSAAHLSSIVIENIVGLKHTFIPFDSGPESISALLGGQVDATITTGSSASRNDEIRILATLSEERLSVTPDMPTFAEIGYEGAVVPITGGALAPPGTPSEIIKVLEEAFDRAAQNPDFIKWAEEAQFGVQPLGSEEFFKQSSDIYRLTESYADLLTN
ncbi:hypothetical protein BTR23_25235 [Alkalihalophilus pseudofirmus]|nr:hypothetical protein BTR23_25235 [Alkalihalophilus pseudofirmus]